jgi:type 1 fimbria pilin
MTMKQKNLLSASLILFLLFTAMPLVWAQARGNGNIEKQERDVGDFTGISVKSGIDLTVSQGEQSRVVIETDENLQEYIITEVTSGILHVYVRKNARISRSSAMDAHVTVKGLDKLMISGGGDVESDGMIHTDDIGIAVSGGGDLQFDLKANRATCEVSGGGDVSLDVDIGEFKAALSGGGDLDLDGDLGLFDLSMSGGGDAEIHGGSSAEGVLADISGGGDLTLEMNCEKIKVSSVGGGDVSAKAGADVSEASFSISGGGDLHLAIGAGELGVEMGGGGDASLSGTARKLACEIRSGGDLHASDFRVNDAKIDLSGGGDARIHVDEKLLLNASGGSQIYLEGDPQVEANLSGGSKLYRQ